MMAALMATTRPSNDSTGPPVHLLAVDPDLVITLGYHLIRSAPTAPREMDEDGHGPGGWPGGRGTWPGSLSVVTPGALASIVSTLVPLVPRFGREPAHISRPEC